jgi:anti-sigma regulatory factor (Ser/Thr protein kinase)
MTSSMTPPPIGAGGLVHEALLYHGPEDQFAALAQFVQGAREAGEPLLVTMPAEHLARLRGHLADEAGSVDYAEIESIASNPICLMPIIEDWVRHRAPRGRARVVCESVWPGRELPETVESLRQEATFNRVWADHPVTMLCLYDADALGAMALEGAHRTHPVLVEHGVRRRSATYRSPGGEDPDHQWPLDPPPPGAAKYHLRDSLRLLREALQADPRIAGLPGERRSDLVLAANEAATNAVQHGDGACAAAVWGDEDRVVVEIRTATPVPDLLSGCRSPDPGAQSGRGLWLINQVCDLVQARSGPTGSVMRMHIRRRRRGGC